MIIKVSFKSHFKLKQRQRDKKKIFTKNILMFLLLTKLFFKELRLTLRLTNKQKSKINILKAPSRHKKFFHQILHEYFNLHIYIYIPIKQTYSLISTQRIFDQLNKVFQKIGSNTLNRFKFLTAIEVHYSPQKKRIN